ncbi:hypothetical protein DFS34DRAFT_649856 [Phlyctochytrium arcticum]|nr:hypothetical protein DFS34DRAFT_649856 [Phlyctochytrium arcticum]
MSDDYWGIDAILAEQQKLPCYFRFEVPGYGFLEGNHDVDLAANTRIELPFWLAEHLALNQYIDIDTPKCFKQRVRDDLKASPTAVNLSRLCQYYYAFGVHFMELMESRLPGVLAEAFRDRLPFILDYAQTSRLRADRSEFVDSLDETERELYKCAHESVGAMAEWDRRKGMRIQTAEILRMKTG